METASEGLKREINAWGLSANLINTIIGASILIMPALVAEGPGSAGILAYLFCFLLITLLSGLSKGEKLGVLIFISLVTALYFILNLAWTEKRSAK